MKQYDLYIFDVDGTIAERDTTDLLPGVAEWFAGNQTAVAFATNQGGVGLRYWMETARFGEPEKYPTAEVITARLESLAEKLQVKWENIYYSFAYQSKSSDNWSPVPAGITEAMSPEWFPASRKPNPGMLLEAISDNRAKSAVMVGDSEEDEAAARAAGIDFIHADDFFGRN